MASHFIGKCKRCKGVVRVEAPVIEQKKAYVGYGRYVTRIYRRLPTGELLEARDMFSKDCLCGGRVVFDRIRGVLSEKHTCGSRCLNSTGPSCECLCGGKNHGAGYGV